MSGGYVASRLRGIEERFQFALILPKLPCYHLQLKNKRELSHQGLKRACDKLQKIIANILWLLIFPELHTSRDLGRKKSRKKSSKLQSFQAEPGAFAGSSLCSEPPSPAPLC